MSCRLVCLGLLLFIGCLHYETPAGAQLPGYRWATGIGGEEDDTTLGLVTDGSGVSFITGYCAGSPDFPGAPRFVCRGAYDAFVARFDVAGRATWAMRFGGTNSDYGQAITLDPAGNVLVAGYFVGEADFGHTNLSGFGRDDCFVAKISAVGQVLWVRQAGGTNMDQGTGIASHVSGDCLVTGFFRNSASFGPTNLTSRGQSDIFIAKYDSTGTLVWVRQAGGAGVDEGKGVAVGQSGDVWVTGLFGDVGTFNNTNVLAQGLGDFFVARYRADGSLAWVTTAGGTNTILADIAAGVTVDKDENCYVSGAFYNNGRIGSVEVPAGDSTALFLAKYSPSGELLWAKPSITSSGGIGWDVAIDRRGTVLMSGSFVGTADFGGVTRSSRTGQAESFLAAYSASGQFLWFSQSGGTAYNSAIGLGVDDEGRAYTGGWYRFGTTFGGIQLSNRPTGRNAYIARIDGLPLLKAASDGTNLLLSWTIYATNFQLQSSQVLPPASWSPVTNDVSVSADRRFVTTPAAENTRYYRLIQQ